MAATQTQNPETAPMPGHRGRAPAGPAPAGPAPAGPAPAGRAPADGRPDIAAALRPLVIDIGIPVGTYYPLRDGFGVSLWLSLALSSVGPAIRAIAGLVAERTVNVLAALMLAVNMAGIAVSFLTGDPRAMIAKDSVVSIDRKSTRLNSSHVAISYAAFC